MKNGVMLHYAGIFIDRWFQM